MAPPTIFIASSSEGLKVVDAVQGHLNAALREVAEVRPWPNTFLLTMAYIESLERLLDSTDFAVLVLTPDDQTTSRKSERWAPRDNVIFELGLFFGRLGRNRCFLIEQRDDLKLPSDLLGLETAAFSISSDQDVRTAVASACSRVASQIRSAVSQLPSMPRIGDQERAIQAAMRRFSDRIAGTWWERIEARGEEPALSFFTIKADEVYGSVQLGGKAYSSDGIHVANWESAAARLEANKVVYVRRCQRKDANTPAWLPGLAEMTFTDSGDAIVQGEGKFWESDESRLADTVIKLVELRRNLDASESSIMQVGSLKDREALVKKRLANW